MSSSFRRSGWAEMTLPGAGNKGANAGELVRAGFVVPDSFIVTIEAYDGFMTHDQLGKTMA